MSGSDSSVDYRLLNVLLRDGFKIACVVNYGQRTQGRRIISMRKHDNAIVLDDNLYFCEREDLEQMCEIMQLTFFMDRKK